MEDEKRGKLKFVGIGIAAVLILVVALVGFNFKNLENQIKRSFSSPEEYYRYVEEREIRRSSKSLRNTYDAWLKQANGNLENAKGEASMKLEIGEKPKELLAPILGSMGEDADLSWLKSLDFNTKAIIEEGIYRVSLDMLLNEKHILGYNTEMSKDKVQFQIPDLSDTGLTMDMEKLGLGQSAVPDVASFYRNLPKGEKLEPLMSKYWLMTLDSVSEITKEKEKLSVGEVSQDGYKLSGKVDREKLKESLKHIEEEAGNDAELKSLVTSVYQSLLDLYGTQYMELTGLPTTPEEMYEKLLTALSEEVKNLEAENEENSSEILLSIWVDNGGTVIGRTLSREGESADTSFTMKIPRDGRKFGLLYELAGSSEQYPNLLLLGNGELNGTNLTGSFDIALDGLSFATVNINRMDTKALEKGSVDFAADVVFKSTGAEGVESLPLDIEAFRLSTELSGDSKEAVWKLLLSYDGERFIDMTMDSKLSPDLEIPAISGNEIDITDNDAMAEWVKNVKWDEFIKNLRETDIPEGWINSLESSVQLMNMYF